MKRKDSILLKYYSNKLPKHQMTGQVDYKKRQEENLPKSVDFLKDWYTKRATLPQFKDVSERRLKILEKPIEIEYLDPQIMNAMGAAGVYSPRKKNITLPDPNPSFADFPEYEKYMQYSTGSPLFTHEFLHRLHYEAPQFIDVVPEKITEKIPGYPELTDPEYISLGTGKIKTGFGKASKFYPEMEAITGMLRQAETIDPLKPVTPDEVSSYIKKYDKYDREIRMRHVDVDQAEEFHRGRLIKQLFDVMGNDPKRIAAYLNSVAKNDNQQDLSLAKWGGLTKYQIKGQVDNSRKPYLPYRVDYIDPRTGKPTSKFYESAEDADYFLNHGALKLVGPQGVQGYYEKPPRKKEVQVSPEEQARLNKQKAIEDTTKSFLEKWYNSPMHREMLKSSLNRGLGLFLDKRTDKMTQDRLKTLPGIKVNVAKMPEAIFDFSDISTLGYVDKDNPSLININAFSTVDDAKGTGVHEGSHLADYAAGIPMKDVKRMRRAASAPTDEYGEYMVGDKSGTETKARIYGGRYELEKAGIYNPFTEKLSKENFEKAEREIPEFKRTNDELRSIYSTDDILNFYNTISKSDNTQSQTMARYGFSVQSKQKALPKHQSIGEVTGKNCVGQCWKPTLSDKSGNSGGMFVGNTPISWSELLKYNEVDTKDKQFKKYLKDLQSKFPGLTKDQLLAAGADSSRIKGRIGDLVTWDKPENQTYDRAWYPFYRSLMQPNVRVTIPQILEFQSQQPGGLGGYQQVVESNYGKKKLRNGGVINMYGPGGATTDGCPAGYDKHPLTGECMPNGWVAPMQAGPTVQNAERLRRAAALNRGTIGPTIGQSRSDEPWRQRQAAEIRRRNAQQNSALAQTMGSFTPSGYNPAAGVIGANTQLIATAVPVVASAIGAAAPYVASALEAPLLGTLGASYGTGALTTGNLINAGFAYHGAKNLPNVAAAWRDVANKPTLSGVGNALGQTALTAIDILPFASTAFKGIPSVMQDINKLKSFRSKTPTSISKEIVELNMTDEELANAIAEIEKNRVNSILGSNNELPPPPAEIRINPDGTYEQIPFGEPFAMSYEEYKNSLNKIKIKNRSGFDKDEILNLTSGKDKDVISKMSDREFENTVLKPTGEIVEYKPGVTIKDMVYDPDTRRMVHKNQSILSEQEYENLFNENLDLLNEIIAKNNKSGLQYKVKELKNGILTFETPEQEIQNVLTDAQKNNISLFQSNPKKYLLDRSLIKKEGDVWKLDEFDDMTFNSIEEAINFSKDQMKQALAPRKISGTSVWSVNPNPGRWSGEVEDIPNKEYFTSIPGLSISSSSSSVFPDFPRRGTRAYESLNEYLKAINLGRVKAGFNSQTNYSKGLWEDAIKKGKAFGYYRRPDVIYGIMKKQGGSINKYGILPKHQIKGQVEPTTADSLEVYNNAVAIRNYYDNLKKKGWYREPKVTNLSGLDKDSFKARMDYVKEKSLRTYRELLKRKKPSGGIFSNDKRHIEFDYFKNVYPNATYDDYIKAVGKSLVQTKAGTGDKYYYKDLFPSVIDPMAPSTLVNLKILPNEELRYSMHPNGDITYTTPPGGPFTGLYTYNPLSVKPAYLRSKQEEDEWQKKYGKSKIQTSKIQTSTTQKQKPQTPKPEEPKLKRKVSMMSPISTQSSYTPSLRMPNIPNIELPPVQSGNYMVGYFDENNQGVDRGFATPEQRDAFVEELRKRDLSGSQPYRGNITQYDRRGRREYGGLVKYQNRGQVNPPIYTDDPRKVQAYNDSLKLYNKYAKDLVNRGSNDLESSFKIDNPLISDILDLYNINKSKVKPIRIDQYNSGYSGHGTSFIPVYKKPVQPYTLQKPGLTRRVPTVEPISINRQTSTPQLRIPQFSNIQLPSIQQGKYKVDYFDPTEEGGVQGGWHTNSFMTSADADEYMKQRSADNKFYGPSMTQRVEYANGGLVEYQTRGQVQPTSADSAALYNNTMALLNYYGNKKKYKNQGVYPVPYDVTNLNMSSMKDMKERLKDRKKHPFTARRWNSNLNVAGSLIGGLLGADIETDQLDPDYDFKMSDYYQRLSPYQYKQKELANNIIDTDAPMGLYDTRIKPTRNYNYSNIDDRSGPIAGTNPLYGDFVNFYGYDPALIKPWNMLTDKEKALRSGKPNQSSTTIVNKKSNPVPNKPQISNSKTTSSKIIQKTQPKKTISLKPFTGVIEQPQPGLKRKVLTVEPISTQSSSLSLKLPNIPNIQMSGAVPQGKYRVEYYDPELKQETHRNFMTQAESDAFTNELSKRNLSGVPSAGNITQRVQYRDGGLVKYQKKGEVKKSPITHYIFAEQDSDNAFQTEANNLKTFISKNYPGENVVILPGRGDDYFNKTVLPTLGKVGKQDRVYLFGHHGSKYAGVPASLWGNAFEQAQKRAGDFNCYLGSCGASDLAGTDPDDWSIGNIDPAFSRLKNFYYRPETIDTRENSGWYGVNPNAQAVPGNSQFGVLNAMYTRSANNPNASKIRDARMNYIDSFYNKDKEYASLNKQAEQLSNQILKDPKNENIKKRLSETFEKMWYRRDTLGRLLDKDRQFIALMKQEEEASKPYIVESPRYGVDFARSTFNPYVNVDRRQEHLKKKREIDTRTLNTNFLSNPFPMFAQGGQRFYGVPRFDEGGTPMCKDSFGNPIPCPPGYTAGSMVFATATPAAQDNTRLPKRIEMTDKAAQAKAVSDAHAFNKAWMNSPMYNKMLQASMAASPSSSSDIPELRKVAADPSRINVQIEDLNNPNLGGTTAYQPTDSTKLSQVKLNPNSRFPFRESAGHEILGHATDMGGILIPQADKDKMNKYFTPVDNTIDPIAELAKRNNMSYAEQKAIIDEKIKNDPQFAKDWKEITELGVDITNATNRENKYIQKPSETRARLMSIRKVAKERGVYDPLTQKMTKENLRKLKELNNDELDFLFKNYTEDELLDMFNTISMNDSSDTQTMARWGGSLKKRSQGGMIEDDMGQLKYPGFPTRIRSKNITMEGVNHPLVAKTNRGITKLLLPNMKYEFEPMTQFVDEHPVPMIPQISNQTPRVMRNFGGEEPPQYINLSLPKMDQKRKKVEINPYIYYERPNPFVNVMGAGFQGNARLNNRWDLTGGMNVGRVNIPTENFSQYLKPNYNIGLGYRFSKGGQHGGLDRWFAEKWVDVKTGKACGRQEGENRAYPACRPSKRVSSQTPKTSSEMSSSEKAKFKSVKQSSQRIPYNHKRR